MIYLAGGSQLSFFSKYLHSIKEIFLANVHASFACVHCVSLLFFVKMQKSRGASAIVLYNTSSIDDKLKFDSKDRTEKLNIPVIYVFKDAAKKYFSDQTATLDMKMKVDIGEKKKDRA